MASNRIELCAIGAVLRRLWRWTLLVGGLMVSGVIVAAVVISYGEYSERHWVPPARWVGLTVFTMFVFGVVISEYGRNWRSVMFWVVIAILIGVHVCTYALILSAVEEWRIIWFAFITMMEIPVLGSILFTRGFRYGPLRVRRGRRRRTAS